MLFNNGEIQRAQVGTSDIVATSSALGVLTLSAIPLAMPTSVVGPKTSQRDPIHLSLDHNYQDAVWMKMMEDWEESTFYCLRKSEPI